MRIKLLLLLAFIACTHMHSTAQAINWNEIETNISKSKNLVDVNKQLEQIKTLAIADKNYALTARCFAYQLKIADKKSEDSSYFKNSFFIDSILQNNNTPLLLQSIMQVLKAKRIVLYNEKFFYRGNKNLIKNYGSEINYATLTKEQLDSLAQMHFEQAKAISLQLTNIKVEELLWLTSDPLLFFFKPQYTDIIYAEQIHSLNFRYYTEQNTSFSQCLSLSPDEMLQSGKIKNMPDNLKKLYSVFVSWANYNAANPSAYYFIESVLRKYLNKQMYQSDEVKKMYESYLEQLVSSPYSTVKAHAVYQLCLYWTSLAPKYSNPLGNDYYLKQYKKFDTSFRYYYKKALHLYQQHEQLLDSFLYVKDILLRMKEKILLPQIDIVTKETLLPTDSIAMVTDFKNVQTLYVRIVKLNAIEQMLGSKEKNINYLENLPSVYDKAIALPIADDYQEHKTIIKLDTLSLGRYAILYSDKPITTATKTADYLLITVSNMAVINNDRRVFVLNRKTGFPFKSTSELIAYKDEVAVTKTTYTVNKEGWAYLPTSAKLLYVVNGKDTLIERFNKPNEDLPREIYNKDDDDDLSDYYEDNIKLCMFTDRAIYRPGQTVQYKGIFLMRNPHTGEPIVLNKKNLKFLWKHKLLTKEMKGAFNEKIELYINDAFNKTLDTIKASINEYGSFAGSYNIKKEAATGEWSFDVDDVEMDNAAKGEFSVEEYKRPSFELTLAKPNIFLKLGDSFVVKATIKSFAGASLNNVSLKYSVNINANIPYTDSITQKIAYQYINQTILDSTATTDSNGEVAINVSASFLKSFTWNGYEPRTVYYTIDAEAIDATGESHEENLKMQLSSLPVNINYKVDNVMERNEMPPINIITKSDFAGELKKEVAINIYRLNKETSSNNIENELVDYNFIHNEWQYKVDNATEENKEPTPTLIYSSKLVTGGNDKFILPKDLLESGFYKMEVFCKEDGMLIGKTIKQFSVFDKINNLLPEETFSFDYLPFNSANKKQTIKWVTGNSYSNVYSIYHAQYFARNKNKVSVKYDYDIKPDKKGINEWSYTIPDDVVSEVLLTHLYILDNELYKETKRIYVYSPVVANPEIIVEQYRKKLTPGGKENFVVSIKTKNENIAVELMTTMYDASLDKIKKHNWELPRMDVRYDVRSEWPSDISDNTRAQLYTEFDKASNFILRGNKSLPLWWINPLGYAYDSSKFTYMLGMDEDEMGVGNMLQGRVAGLYITNTTGLNEVVVTGAFGMKRSERSATSTVTIRGNSSISSYNIPLVILDGVVYEGDINKINLATIIDGIILKGADASALYGSRAANGVIVLSTKGPVQLPKPEAPPIVVRKNFSETAFFYPQIHASKDGYYNISFTMPESVTEWKWKLLAHTKDAKFAQTERNIYTQLPMMVQPNMPRFLYQGDKIILQTRITNLDTMDISGTIKCIVEDAVTGDDMSAIITKDKQQLFSVKQKSNSNISVQLNIPDNLLHPLRIRITATAGVNSDGEEHIIPVLSKKILAVQNIPFTLVQHKDSIIHTPVLPADATPYGTSLYITAKPQSAMINALPYLAFDEYNCAEQTFNKLLAHAIAAKILRTDIATQQSLLGIAADTNQKISSLPEELDEQTMPWLQLNHASDLQQKQLVKLFDTLSGNEKMATYFEELKGLQNADGGITWFKGGKSNGYISLYILNAFGKMQKDKLLNFKYATEQTGYNNFISALVNYCDKLFLEENSFYNSNLFYIQARTFWLKEYGLQDAINKKVEAVLSKAWQKVDSFNLNQQAGLILASMRYSDKGTAFYKNALQQLESIKQLAIADAVNGVRWKAISNSDDLNTSDEETVAALATAFLERGVAKETVDGIIKWLLTAKTEHNWSTTKSTADIVNLLQNVQPSVTDTPVKLSATLNNSIVTVTDNLLKGQLSAFTPLTQFAALTTIKKDSDSTTTGGLNYYYFTANPITENNNGLKIFKTIYKYNEATFKWETIADNAVLKIADKLKTIITIEAPKQLKYVFIDEKRAAGLEPTDALSGYEYGNRFSYYKSVRDVGYQFFAEQIPSGISTIEYESVVAKQGVFYNGTVSLQCMYQPQTKAYGTGSILQIK